MDTKEKAVLKKYVRDYSIVALTASAAVFILFYAFKKEDLRESLFQAISISVFLLLSLLLIVLLFKFSKRYRKFIVERDEFWSSTKLGEKIKLQSKLLAVLFVGTILFTPAFLCLLFAAIVSIESNANFIDALDRIFCGFYCRFFITHSAYLQLAILVGLIGLGVYCYVAVFKMLAKMKEKRKQNLEKVGNG